MVVGYTLAEVGQLTLAPWNYKTDDPDMLEKLKANIKKNGMIENLIVRTLDDGTIEVVNGNHRLQAAIDLGIEKVMVFNLGYISDADAKRIAIETNETRFGVDNEQLSSLLQEINGKYDLEDLAESMPFNAIELEALMNGEMTLTGLTVNLDEEPEGALPTLPEEEPRMHRCPRCGHEWDGASR